MLNRAQRSDAMDVVELLSPRTEAARHAKKVEEFWAEYSTANDQFLHCVAARTTFIAPAQCVLVCEEGIGKLSVRAFASENLGREASSKLWCCWVLFSRREHDDRPATVVEISHGGVGFAHGTIRAHAERFRAQNEDGELAHAAYIEWGQMTYPKGPAVLPSSVLDMVLQEKERELMHLPEEDQFSLLVLDAVHGPPAPHVGGAGPSERFHSGTCLQKDACLRWQRWFNLVGDNHHLLALGRKRRKGRTRTQSKCSWSFTTTSTRELGSECGSRKHISPLYRRI